MGGDENESIVVVVGASDNPARYSYMAIRMLEDYGFAVRLVSPRVKEIEGRRVYPSITSLAEEGVAVDSVTLYVGAPVSSRMTAELVALAPRRVVFNPGAENPELSEILQRSGVQTIDACTLVMLRTGSF